MRRTSKEVIIEVASRYGLTYDDMVSDSRVRKGVAWPRQEAMYEVRRQCPHLTKVQIGKAFRRHHATIIYGIQSFKQRTARVGRGPYRVNMTDYLQAVCV